MEPTPTAFDDALQRAAAPWNLNLAPAQITKMREHHAMMVEANRTMNLTRITDPIESAIKHYADSLALVACATQQNWTVETVLDIGTGAGVPAIPIAIARPDWTIIAIDGTRKKIDFLKSAATALGLANLSAEHAHSSHWEKNQTFDVVTLRAVANPLETAKRFVNPGGWIVHFATANENKSSPLAKGGKRGVKPIASNEPKCFPYTLTVKGKKLDRELRLIQLH